MFRVNNHLQLTIRKSNTYTMAERLTNDLPTKLFLTPKNWILKLTDIGAFYKKNYLENNVTYLQPKKWNHLIRI